MNEYEVNDAGHPTGNVRSVTAIEIEDVQRLNVKPGDALLVTVPPGTSQEIADYIKNKFETTLPVRVIVKTLDVEVEVVEAAAVPPDLKRGGYSGSRDAADVPPPTTSPSAVVVDKAGDQS